MECPSSSSRRARQQCPATFLCSHRSVSYAFCPSSTCSYWRLTSREDQTLFIGERLRALREEKDFSQGDVEKRTGLLRCYISRVEHGYTVPAVETLEKFARALEVRRVSSSAEIASPG